VVIVGSEGFIHLYLIIIICTVQYLYDPSLALSFDSLLSSVRDPDSQDPHVLGIPDPDLFVSSMDPDPYTESSLFS
jgi:hypothetical protein